MSFKMKVVYGTFFPLLSRALLLVSSVLVIGFAAVGCVVGDIGVSVPGCESCPDRCLRGKNDRWGRCVTCLKDEQCQSSVSPTRRCSTNNRCICGTNKDCPDGQFCIGEGGCVECKKDEDCTNPKQAACVGNKCLECRRGDIRSCGPAKQTACKKGTQTCMGGGIWSDCKDWLVCKSGERCESETCVPKCSQDECKVGDRRCVSGSQDQYQRCLRNSKGCLSWSQEETCKTGTACKAGACENLCGSGETLCGKSCVNLQTSTQHCGACNNACSKGEGCDSGKCAAQCTPPNQNCADSKSAPLCVNQKTNAKHCGTCNSACKANETCVSGKCEGPQCKAGEKECSGKCVDVRKNTQHCGQCGKTCPTGQGCVNGSCVTLCSRGQTLCNNRCYNTQADPSHCGACNNACRTGQTCASGKCSSSCSAGQTLCGGVCVNTSTDTKNCGGCGKSCASQEICRSGACQSSCPAGQTCGSISVSGGITDYAVLDSGDVFVVHSVSSRTGIQGTCYRATGAVLASKFTINGVSSLRQESPSVHTSHGADRFVVAWLQRSTSSSSTRNLHFRIYDNLCKPVTSKITWPYANGGGESNYSVAMDKSGRVVLLFRDDKRDLRLVTYDRAGKKVKELLVEASSTSRRCRGNSYGYHVSMNESGAGLVTCQNHSSDPIYYRRFSAQHSFLDSSLILFQDSSSNSSWYASHASGINNSGAFVIEWQSYKSRDNRATFFDAKAKVVQPMTVVSNRVGRGYDGFRNVHQEIQRLGNDFVLRDTVTSSSDSPVWYRYSSGGKLLSALRGAYEPWLLRTNRTSAYVVSGSKILTVNLSVGQGLCQGKPCVCTPNSTQSCYRGSTSLRVRGACKIGTQTCNRDGLSWGSCVGEVLPTPEVCNNRIDDDCDGQTDENCTNPSGVDTPGLTDYSVASNGTWVGIYWTGKALLGYCFHSNGTVKQKTFVIDSGPRSVTQAIVKISRNANYIAVLWRATDEINTSLYNSMFRLYDASCKPLNNKLTIQKNSGSYHDVAIDNSGRSFLVYYNDKRELMMRRFSSKGAPLAAAVGLDPNRRKCRNAAWVGVSATTGNGVFSCQNHLSNPIYFRQFTASGKLQGTDLVEVQNTSRNSSWYVSHLLGVNDNGEFVVKWQSHSKKTFFANFYSATGTLVKSVTVGTTMSWTFDAFRFAHHGVPLFGNDFVLRDGGYRSKPVTWFRYTPKGVQVSKVSMPTTGSYRRESLRTDGTKSYIIENRTVRVGSLVFR